MTGDQDESNAVERRGSYLGQRRKSSIAENEPLLSKGLDGPLYRTLSHASEAILEEQYERDIERNASVASQGTPGIYATLSVLLLGVFISQTDQSFVLATYGAVSSEFDDLDSGSWLISAYILGQCVAQPLYGKISDIYGRKAALQASYFLFVIGTAVSGLGQSMGHVIAGRAIQGAGGAGMISMVSIIITDLVPLHEVATLWSYVNMLQTTGRSAGGFLGGLITQALGWRLAFLVQIPPIVIAILLVTWKLHVTPKHLQDDLSRWEKLKRVDFIGAFFLCYTVFAACFILDSGGQKYPWDSPIIIGIIVSGIVTACCFVVSAKRVKEPIFPLRLLAQYSLVTNYTIVVLQIMVQMSMMMAVPLYFQSTKHATTAETGAYLIPAFAGNTLGSLASGYWIRRTGRFKWPTVAAPVLSTVCATLILGTWNGDTSIWQSSFIFIGGFATGMIVSSAFVGMAAGVAEEDVALAGSGMYLFFNVGAIAGASAGGAAYQIGLMSGLNKALEGVNDRDKIYRQLLENIRYLWTLSSSLRQQIMPAYVQAFHHVIMLGLVCAILSFIVASVSRGKTLERPK